MRAIRVASAALLGVTALTFTAPAAFAGDRDDHNITPFAFSVQPSTIAAGGQVSLLLKRDGGCRGTRRSPPVSSTPSRSRRASPRPPPWSTGTPGPVRCTT